MDHSLDRFLLHIQYEKRYSLHTLTAYREDIRQFFDYLSLQFGLTEPESVSHTFVRSWMVSLMERQMSTRAVNRKISSLRSFFRFLIREKIIHQNPMMKVTGPKNSKKLPVFVSKNNMDLLFEHVAIETDFTGIRDRTILELFYATGMRLSELINLSHNDLNIYNGTIKVLGKRNKERIIPLTHSIISTLKIYLARKKENHEGQDIKEDLLFLSLKGTKLNPKSVYRIIKKYLSLVTTLDKRSPHVLRHTFATHLLNNGADINVIKEILGHSSLAATQVYTHNTIEKLKDAHRQAHPKA